MAKSIMLGNGSMLVGLDYFGQVKDLYYHYAGLENHIGHRLVHKIGIFVDGAFSWIDDGSWNITVESEDDTMASKITAKSDDRGLEIRFSDVVYNERNIFVREVTVKNIFERKRDVKVFFNQQFTIAQTYSGETGYYDPEDNAVIHYKGRRVFLVNAKSETTGIDDFCIGLMGIEGKEGAFKDAEDGLLSKNPIEHGQVDSVITLTLTVPSKKENTFHYWIIAAKSIAKAKELNHEVLSRGPNSILVSTKNYWKAWVNLSNENFYDLDASIVTLFKKSLLAIRTHGNKNGAIIASGDSDMLQFGRDYYEYVWPRDGAYVASALMNAGYANVARSFFEFCNDVITKEGYFMHKYRPDKSLGSSWHPWFEDGNKQLPIQEDETAIVVWALWNYFSITHDLEFIETVYHSLIKSPADFMVSYRDEKTGLPLPSYDLWEMYYGVNTYTASCVSVALHVASQFADLLGKSDDKKTYANASEEIKKGVCRDLYNKKAGVFYKSKGKTDDETLDFSSVFAVFKFGVLDIDDDRLEKAIDIYRNRLELKTDSGGVARFEGDIYQHIGGDYPGNPWIVTTMWLAQYSIAKAKTVSDMKEAKKWLQWCVDNAGSGGVLPEQLNPYNGDHVSATPLMWSHAEFVTTVVLYREKMYVLSV